MVASNWLSDFSEWNAFQADGTCWVISLISRAQLLMLLLSECWIHHILALRFIFPQNWRCTGILFVWLGILQKCAWQIWSVTNICGFNWLDTPFVRNISTRHRIHKAVLAVPPHVSALYGTDLGSDAVHRNKSCASKQEYVQGVNASHQPNLKSIDRHILRRQAQKMGNQWWVYSSVQSHKELQFLDVNLLLSLPQKYCDWVPETIIQNKHSAYRTICQNV